jgi:cytochrome c-type biogenesis protein CcmE
MAFALRVLVMSAIMTGFYLVRGLGSVVETFAAALVAVLASHVAVVGLQLGRPPDQVSRSRRVVAVLAVALVAVGALACFLAAFAAQPASNTYRTVDEVMADPAAVLGRELRIHGYLELGSLQAQVVDQQVTRSFALVEHRHRIAARVTGVVPETFAERAEVIATGRLIRGADGRYLFEARDVIAKCPSTYQTASGPVPAARFR